MIENDKKIGKPRLSMEERTISEENKVNRTKIANMIRRKPEIKKHCCICGSEDAEILHNKYPKDPYIITFICKQCRKYEENLLKADKLRFDIREIMNKSTLSVKNFVKEDVKNIVEDYLMNTLPIGIYCEKIGISRHQFNQLVKRYGEMYNDITIHKKVINHANKVGRKSLSKSAIKRNQEKRLKEGFKNN